MLKLHPQKIAMKKQRRKTEVAILDFVESAWLILFFVSIVFIFMMIFTELGEQTKKIKEWQRISYGKMLPRISLSYQHFNRKGFLLTNTSFNICRSVRKDMTDYLQVAKGYSVEEIEELLSDKEKLYHIFQNDEVVLFLYDPSSWLKMQEVEPTIISKLFKPLQSIFGDREDENKLFYTQLAYLIHTFRKIMETGI